MNNNAKWIKSPVNEEDCCYEFYTGLNLEKPVKNAVLTISAMGLYCAYINGVKVGNELFTPYWTEYNKRIQYQTYDVTDMLAQNSVLSILCAEGWAVGFIGAGAEKRRHYAENMSIIFSLEITYDDGSHQSINSDNSVRVRTSAILSTSIYNGEYIDKTAEIRELGNGLPDTAKKGILIPQQGEKVVEQEIIRPVKLIITPLGLILDKTFQVMWK